MLYGVNVVIPIVFGVLTALLGGGAVILLEWYHHGELHVPSVFWLGDCVFLACYNAVTVGMVLNESFSRFAVISAALFTLAFSFFYQFCEDQFRTGNVSPAVLYHLQFIMLQSFYVALSFYALSTLWPLLLLIAYAVTLSESVLW
jgi:hypothetical protein